MSKREEKYNKEDLQEFRKIIVEKLDNANQYLKELEREMRNLTRASHGTLLEGVESSAEVSQKESLNQIAARQKKFIKHLEAALQRIEKGTYGICVVTNRLISKDRLRLVPHTNHSIEAKMKK